MASLLGCYTVISCVDYDGNLLDASVFALLAALKNGSPKPNTLLEIKSTINTAKMIDFCTLLVDPTAEEDLATGTVTIVSDEEGRLCSVHKPGGSPLTGAKLQDCITRAITRHKEVKKLIDKVIKSIMPK